MGLDTSHDAWHGAYSAFMRWREMLAKTANLPPLRLMEGFYKPLSSFDVPTLYFGHETRNKEFLQEIDEELPISWGCLKPDVLHQLLYHSDSQGEIENSICGLLADRLDELLPLIPDEDGLGHIGNYKEKTRQFINGLRIAFDSGEDLEFH